MKNAHGTFSTPEIERDYARSCLWATINEDEECRHIIDELRDQPLIHYQRGLDSEWANQADRDAFDGSIREWMTRYNCSGVEWIERDIMYLLEDWSRQDSFSRRYIRLVSTKFSALNIAVSATSGLPDFSPGIETPDEYAKRIIRDAERRIESDELLQNAPSIEKRRFVRTIREIALRDARAAVEETRALHPGWRLSKDFPKRAQHIRWFVRSYMLGRSFTESGMESNGEEFDKGQVSKVARAIARLIEFPCPPHLRPGRPPGRKSDPITTTLAK